MFVSRSRRNQLSRTRVCDIYINKSVYFSSNFIPHFPSSFVSFKGPPFALSGDSAYICTLSRPFVFNFSVIFNHEYLIHFKEKSNFSGVLSCLLWSSTISYTGGILQTNLVNQFV